MAATKEVPTGARRFERIGAHTHINGWASKKLKAIKVKDAMVGQERARERRLKSSDDEGSKLSGKTIIPVGHLEEAKQLSLSPYLSNRVPKSPLSR